MSKRPISLSPARPLPHLSVFLCPFLVRRSYCSSGCSFIERDIAERGKKRKRWHAFSARCSASPARVACHLSDRGVTASTVEGTPLRHNGTDWAATDLSVCLSVKPVHQLSVTQTCLSICTVPLFGLLSVLQPIGKCTICAIFFQSVLFTWLHISQIDLHVAPVLFLSHLLSEPAFTQYFSLWHPTFPSATVCIGPSTNPVSCRITHLTVIWLLWHFSIVYPALSIAPYCTWYIQ